MTLDDDVEALLFGYLDSIGNVEYKQAVNATSLDDLRRVCERYLMRQVFTVVLGQQADLKEEAEAVQPVIVPVVEEQEPAQPPVAPPVVTTPSIDPEAGSETDAGSTTEQPVAPVRNGDADSAVQNEPAENVDAAEEHAESSESVEGAAQTAQSTEALSTPEGEQAPATGSENASDAEQRSKRYR